MGHRGRLPPVWKGVPGCLAAGWMDGCMVCCGLGRAAAAGGAGGGRGERARLGRYRWLGPAALELVGCRAGDGFWAGLFAPRPVRFVGLSCGPAAPSFFMLIGRFPLVSCVVFLFSPSPLQVCGLGRFGVGAAAVAGRGQAGRERGESQAGPVRAGLLGVGKEGEGIQERRKGKGSQAPQKHTIRLTFLSSSPSSNPPH